MPQKTKNSEHGELTTPSSIPQSKEYGTDQLQRRNVQYAIGRSESI